MNSTPSETARYAIQQADAVSNPSNTVQIGIILAVLAAFGFSFKSIFIKLAYAAAPVDAVTMMTLRMTLSLPFVLLMGFKVLREGPALTRKDIGLLLFLGMAGYYGSSILDFWGLEYISAGLERLILFVYPTITILIGIVFFKKRVDRTFVLAIVLAYAGILLAFMHDAKISTDIRNVLIGGGLVFASAVLYAIYNVGAEIGIRRFGSMKFAVLALLVSTGATEIHFISTHTVMQLNLPVSIYAYGIGMALFSTVLPIFWQSAAIRNIGAERAVMIGMIGPMLTIFFSWWLLHEPISMAQMMGTVLVMVGVFMAGKTKGYSLTRSKS